MYINLQKLYDILTATKYKGNGSKYNTIILI